ncbi:diguanylate cyclase (GGDEF) domain-containing protein [Marinobacter antarcticus]|uniref:cyclic-guanylate-specific phosphodiesterase n=1 Tax=Marinobacter antarcticus TaxID=564117 RepID=A0A1M6PZC5_9GAMM|nr:EAL domain-containing protein [Marinobacter antarcticus]SHK13299.1 diguanylate cyclase (GGDEF) domain-containing protein [Marinobacter antarcticus]
MSKKGYKVQNTGTEPIVPSRARAAQARKYDADLRCDSGDLRKKATGLRQSTADLREDIADLREDTADQREEAVTAKTKLSTTTQSLLKDANERLIIASINAQTMTESAELANEQMSHMASHDYLTGLPNRSLLNDRMAQSMAFSQRHGKKVALMFMDLDHFKNINDSLGHSVGDKLLKSIAKRLKTCIRDSDTVCRQGGDEFVVLLNEIENINDAVVTAEKIIEAMGLPHFVSGHQLNVTFSIGISIYPDDGEDHETVARKADAAMYQAKEKGRNTYQMFIKEMEVRALARQSMEQELHCALEQNKFVLHYQPKVNLETGLITGVEALIRIRESDNQLVYPEHFISIAEDCGLILPVGRWVLREACRQAQEWLHAGFDIGQIAVNVSAREFHSQDFLAGVISVLNETGLDPRRLELEITESGLMKDTEQLMAILHGLKKLGVRIAIDDFGTGYSSLSYLARFPLDTLKIDQSFVHNLDDASRDTENAIISAVIAMSESLKHRVVAEGIETKQQLGFLKSKNCTEGQGYYFSRPVAAEDFTALMAASF